MSYTDGTGDIPPLTLKNLGSVEGKSSPNRAPDFGKSRDERTIAENAAAAAEVGAALGATDPENDTRTYSISGTDAAFFSIDETDGQISVRTGTRLDHEKKNSYRMTVTVEDPNGLKDTLTLTIMGDGY